MHQTTRAEKRHYNELIKNKAKHFLKNVWHYSSSLAENPKIVGFRARTPTPCSCSMCGNPRKYFKQKTRKEVLAYLNAIEQFEDTEEVA